jgi:hypothetical protein
LSELSFREHTSAQGASALQQTLTTTVHDDRVVLSWTCPTCKHASSQSVSLRGRIYGLLGRLRRRRTPQRTTEVVRCACSEVHPGGGDDAIGCGFYAQVTFTITAS